jgi:hypothetical protein
MTVPREPAPVARAARLEAFPADKAEQQKEVLDEKKFVTGRISETTRYLAFGLVASFYAIVSSSDAFPRALAATYGPILRVMALAALLALVFDYLQYLFGRAAAEYALKRTDKPFTYNKKWRSAKAKKFCFWAKQLLVMAGCVILIAIIALGP